MKAVESYEVKTHLPRLLERVAKGEKIVITKHGKPIAMLVPPPGDGARDVKKTVKKMLEWRDREGPKLGGVTIRELIEEGRR